MKKANIRMVHRAGRDENMRLVRLTSRATLGLFLAATPIVASAAETGMPQYEQPIACSGYYTILHSYMDRENPGASQTLQYKRYASDWLKLAALLREPSDDLERDYIAKQEDANSLILDDTRVAELKQVQNYCMATGNARLKWDQK